eukprot:3283981-Rhodomonas_salina.1
MLRRSGWGAWARLGVVTMRSSKKRCRATRLACGIALRNKGASNAESREQSRELCRSAQYNILLTAIDANARG